MKSFHNLDCYKSTYSASTSGLLAGQTFPGPNDITRNQLSNGIVILSRSNFNSPSVVVNGYLPIGSILDPDEKLGLADFVSSGLMRGTKNRTFQLIFDLLESNGGNLGFNCGMHTTNFGGRSLAEDFELIIELLADILRNPEFPNDQIERLRAQIMTGLAIRTHDTAEMASITFDQIVYKNHPYSRPEEGYPETIERITQDDLHKFHKENFGASGLIITIVGAIDSKSALELVKKYFGDWNNDSQKKDIDLPALSPINSTQKEYVNIPGKVQADIIVGAAGPSRNSDEFIPAVLGNNILGQFGMMGRIGHSVREKAGLAYYAHSNLSGGIGPGPWTISAGVAPENVEQILPLIEQEIFRFVNELVSDEELSDTQANFIGRLPLSLESNGGVASALTNLEKFDLGLDYYQRYKDIIMHVTKEQILDTAQKYLNPKALAIAIAGSILN